MAGTNDRVNERRQSSTSPKRWARRADAIVNTAVRGERGHDHGDRRHGCRGSRRPRSVSVAGSGATVAPSVTISETPRKIIIPARVTMNDDTPTLATHTAFHVPSTTPAAIAAATLSHGFHPSLDRERGEHDADEGDRRPDGQVEVAGHDQHHGADRGQPDDRRLQGEQSEVALRQEQPVGEHLERAEHDGDDDQQGVVAQVDRAARVVAA